MENIIKKILRESDVFKEERYLNYVVNSFIDRFVEIVNNREEMGNIHSVWFRASFVLPNNNGDVFSIDSLRRFRYDDLSQTNDFDVEFMRIMKDYGVNNIHTMNDLWTMVSEELIQRLIDTQREYNKKHLNESTNRWSKLHRFQDFVVDDLFNDTKLKKIDYDQQGNELGNKFYVLTPFNNAFMFNRTAFFNSNLKDRPDFVNYVFEKYGVDSMMVKLIWDLYRMRVLNDIFGDEVITESENKREKFINVVANDMFIKTYFRNQVLFGIVTPFGYDLSKSWFKKPKSERILERYFINVFYNHVSETYGVDIQDGWFIEKVMSLYFEKITNKVLNEDNLNESLEYYGVDDASPENDEYEMGLKEDVPIYKDHNLGKGMYQRLRDHFPKTPEYILKDYFYNNIVGDIETINKYYYGDPILATREGWSEYLNGPWKLQILTVNPEDFDDTTVNAFIERDFGNVDAYQVPNDEERMEIQNKLAKSTGMNEPVIVEKTKNGKYKLIEGWHRTMSILLLGDNGEDLKNWDKVKIRAFVRDKWGE